MDTGFVCQNVAGFFGTTASGYSEKSECRTRCELCNEVMNGNISNPKARSRPGKTEHPMSRSNQTGSPLTS